MILILISFLCFSAVCYQGWLGQLGGLEILLLGVAAASFWKGRKGLEQKKQVTQIAKLLFTCAGIMVLLRHPIDTGFVDAVDAETQVLVDWRGAQETSVQLTFTPTSSEQGKELTQEALWSSLEKHPQDQPTGRIVPDGKR